MADILSEREKLREEKENNERMLRELAKMREEIESMTQERDWPEEVKRIVSEELEEVGVR